MKAIYIVGILFLLLIFYAVSNVVWVHSGASLYGRDVVGHLQLVEKFYYRIGDVAHGAGSPPAKAVKILSLLHEDSLPFHGTYMWPKLVHLTATIPCFVFGLRPMVMIQFNLLFLGILITSVYFIGKRCHSSSAGLFAAVLVCLYPAIWGQSRKFGLDLPVTAMTSLAIAALVYTDHFCNRGYSLLLGVLFGLGILTKGQIILYLGGPLLVDFCVGLWKERTRRRALSVNFAIVILLALVTSSPWWWGNVLALWRAYFGTVTDYQFSWAYAYKKQVPFSLRWFLFHPVHVFISISLLYACLFALSLPGYVRSRSGHKMIIASWVLAAYAIWTVSNIKRDTDFYPCLPAFALITAIGVMSWESRLLKRLVVIGSVLLGLAQYLSVSFSPAGYSIWTPKNPYDKPCEPDGYNTPFQPPYPNNYREVMQRIAHQIKTNDPAEKYARIGIIETTGSERWMEYNTAILEYYFRCYSPDKFIYRSRYTPEAFIEHAESFKYLLVLDRRNGETPDWSEVRDFFSSHKWDGVLRRSFGSVDAFFRVLESYEDYTVVQRATLLPDGCGVFLCRRNPLRVSTGEVIHASDYADSNLITTPLSIGSERIPSHAMREPDYDPIFPYWLRFPLVDNDLRYPGDPYFCEYELEFAEGGSFDLSGQFGVTRECSISVYCDGRMLGRELNLYPQGDTSPPDYAWFSMGTMTLSPGTHRIRIEGKDDFPHFSALRFSKL